MMTKYSLLSFLLVTFNTFAGEANIKMDLSEIRAVEQQQIIDSLSYRLVTQQSCDLVKQWSDSGSGAQVDGSFYIPSAADNVFIIGGFGTQQKSKSHCVTTVSISPNNPEDAPVLLVSPVDWKMIWNDKGSGADKDGSMWQAISPDSQYICLGTVPQKKYRKPDLPNYRCVHQGLVEKVVSKEMIWSDFGSFADKKVTMLKLPNTNSFVAVPGNVSEIETFDLKADPVIRPDPKKVDEILAVRMAKIEKDLQSEVQGQLAKKQQAEAAEKQRLAAAAEQKKLAEEAQQKEAEQKRLAEEAEKQRLSREAGKNQQAAAVKQQPVPEAPEKMPLAQETEEKPPVQTKEPEPVVEAVETPEVLTAPDTDSVDRDEVEPSGMSSLYAYLLKVFLTVSGVLIVLGFIFYKLMFRKNKTE